VKKVEITFERAGDTVE